MSWLEPAALSADSQVSFSSEDQTPVPMACFLALGVQIIQGALCVRNVP